MAMKLGKKHLQIVLVLVVLSLAYNVWVFMRPSGLTTQTGAAEAPLLSSVDRPARSIAAPAATQPRATDPMTIPAPPALDLTTQPNWLRDPFLALGETRDPRIEVPVVSDPAGPEPVISSILYSSTRRSALVNRRIVTIGDPLGGGVIDDILPNAVVIRMPSGARRRVEMAKGFTGDVGPAASNLTRSR